MRTARANACGEEKGRRWFGGRGGEVSVATFLPWCNHFTLKQRTRHGSRGIAPSSHLDKCATTSCGARSDGDAPGVGCARGGGEEVITVPQGS
jgi:hypothetical protein